MSQWTSVASLKSRAHRPSKKTADGKALTTADEIQAFLKTFKTMPCPKTTGHGDRRCCPFYHNQNDKRRDPYFEYYTPEECVNAIEKTYHPVLFRTRMCDRKDKCPFPSTCSFAHSDASVHNRSNNTDLFEEFHSRKQAYLE